ncbi:enhanced serine sensitivity protein SseB C-terminal domain-containing protein [Neobacillus mesonae]|uniref:enhanced serine sensitivity protein SseB C-terminal domain-containing protein n=1 Tax=Neobacillus mesonae TaxID=1193713 RepID=UPI00203D67B3|nr:enhanced serine sensitivity protein SseB C-terminal domain-containing protein [Neobacillus mesonae]MCM3570429.1 enhanced serine sensitivity protein SseB [Neobacillus mesonae]
MNKAGYQELDPMDSLLLAASENPDKRYPFYLALLDWELVVPGTAAASGEDPDEIELSLKYIEVEQELILPVFSSQAKFQTIFQGKYSYVKIDARELLPLIEPKASLVLNPGFDLAKQIIPEEIETLKDGSILQYFFDEMSPEAKREFLTERMVEVAETTLASISECLRGFPSIKKAYLTSFFDPVKGGVPRPLIGLEADDEGNTQLLSIVEAVEKNVPEKLKFEFAILHKELPLTCSTVQEVKPFYVRDSEDQLRTMFR